ncbi:MAG: hypothetical protein AB1498_08840 [bacterium]
MNYLKTSLFIPITVVCFSCFLLSFISVTLSTFLGICLSFWLIMRGRPDGILGLFLLYLTRYYFYNINDGSIPDEFREYVIVAGLPINVETVACGFISLRVFLEKLVRPRTFKSQFPKILLSLWLTAFLPVLIGFYLAYQTRNPNWTRGLRFLMITGSYFYGYILAKHWPREKNDILIPILLPFVIIMFSLMCLGVYWSHHGFLFMGLSGAFSIYLIYNRPLKYRLLGILVFFLLVEYAIKGSITTIGIISLSVLLSYLGEKKQKPLINTSYGSIIKRPNSIFRNRIAKFIGGIAILGILFFSAGISLLGYHPDYKPSLSHGSYYGTFAERFKAKLLSDRLPFWHAALKQIISGPYFVIPSGKPLLLETPGLPDEWVVGAHNTALEILRLDGLFAGTIMLVILFLALKNNLLVLTKSTDPVLKSLAAGILGVGIVGMTTGDFPADQTVGFWIWSLAGLCHCLFLQDSPLSENRQLRPFQRSQSLVPGLKR